MRGVPVGVREGCTALVVDGTGTKIRPFVTGKDPLCSALEKVEGSRLAVRY